MHVSEMSLLHGTMRYLQAQLVGAGSGYNIAAIWVSTRLYWGLCASVGQGPSALTRDREAGILRYSLHVCVCVCVSVCVYIYIYTYIHISTYTCTYTCTFTHT